MRVNNTKRITLNNVYEILFLFIFMASNSYADSLASSVDRNRAGVGEILYLEVKWGGQATGSPDFSALQRDFDILSRSQQNQFSFGAGKNLSYTTWRLELLPKREGKLLIPSFNFKGEVSNAIEIEVSEAARQSLSEAPVYIETELNKERLYVQEQLLLTHRIVTRVDLQGISTDELTIPGANVVKVAENQFQKHINGVAHRIIEVKYAIFPQTSGDLEIPAVRFSTVISNRRDPFSGMFSRGGKRLILNSESRTVPVLPRPASATGDWLPSAGVSLAERWSQPLDEWRAGEPITRTITLTAQGLTGVQLPPLPQPTAENLKTYPDQPQLDDKVSSDGVIGQRVETMAMVPSKPGAITLPPIRVQWWNSKTKRLEETTLEGHTIQVLPAPGGAEETERTASTRGGTTTEPAPWQVGGFSGWVALLAISNLVSLLVIIRLLTGRASEAPDTAATTQASEATLFRQVAQAAGNDQPGQFREAVIAWGRAFWQNPELNTLGAITAQAGSAELQTNLDSSFRQLDASLFATSEQKPDLTKASALVKQLRQQASSSEKPARGAPLKPLYGA